MHADLAALRGRHPREAVSLAMRKGITLGLRVSRVRPPDGCYWLNGAIPQEGSTDPARLWVCAAKLTTDALGVVTGCERVTICEVGPDIMACLRLVDPFETKREP